MVEDPKTKKCPYCAETIQAEAVYCRYCHKDIPPALVFGGTSIMLENEKPKPEKKLKPLMGWVQWTMAMVGGFGIAMSIALNQPTLWLNINELYTSVICNTGIYFVAFALFIWIVQFIKAGYSNP